MSHRLRPVEPRQLARERHPARPCEIAKPRLVVMWPRPVELASVAGEEQERGAASRVLMREQLVELGARERKRLANADGRRMVAYANDMEGDLAGHVPRVHGRLRRDNTHPSGSSLRRNTEQSHGDEHGQINEMPPGCLPGGIAPHGLVPPKGTVFR